MTKNDQPDNEKGEMRVMWIATGVIVLVLLGGMGINMLLHPSSDTPPTDLTSQSRKAPAQ